MTKSNFLKAVFHKFFLVHAWILCPICNLTVFIMKIKLTNWTLNKGVFSKTYLNTAT